MKMPHGIFITYACDVIGSSEVNMEIAFTVFKPVVCVSKGILYIFFRG
jgi:hypothetical protein